MPRVTTDRGAVVHFAGACRLSPALDDQSRPAFSAQAGDGLARCGWESFFAAVRAGGLALEYEAEDPASARFVPATQARRVGGRRLLAEEAEHARRFWRALVS